MKRLAVAAMLLFVTASARVASAEDTPSDGGTGPRFGLRTGYMAPLGEAAQDAKLADVLNGGVPIWVDAGYRVIPSVYVGFYLDYAFLGVSGKTCPTTSDCTAHQIRIGVMGAYHFVAAGPIDPWVGLGVGYEIIGQSVSSAGVAVDGSTKGLELVNLQGGADYKVTPSLRVGPFVSLSLGEFSSQSSGGTSTDIARKALHAWFTIGVRGAFDLNLN